MDKQYNVFGGLDEIKDPPKEANKYKTIQETYGASEDKMCKGYNKQEEGDKQMEVNELIEKAHKNAVMHDFWDFYENIDEDNRDIKKAFISQFLLLIAGEVSEATEALRKENEENFKEELADVFIRLGDLCGGLDIDIEKEITKKMDKNRNRPYKHGKTF